MFPIFAESWFAFSLAARHNVGNNSPSQAHHNSTVKRHLTPSNRFQNTQKPTYVKWSTITRITQTLARMDGERMRAYPILNRRRRSELLSTLTELTAMAPAASTGLRKPYSPRK